jgi:hypothetical protein
MTLQTTIPLAEYVENGVTLVHPIPFQFVATTDIVCSRITDGAEVVLTPGADYVVTGGEGATGTVTKTGGGTPGTTFRIKRQTTRAQPTDYTPGDAFPAESHEQALDRLAAVNQEQDVAISDLENRTVRVPVGETAQTLPTKIDRAGKYQAYDADGNSIASSGTGNDSALRTDLAATPGSLLINWLLGVAGAVARTVQSKLRDRVHIKDFNSTAGTGGDDTVALAAFFNSAIASPGRIHELDAVTYTTTLPLPQVNQPNVWIEGKGAHIHDGGVPQISGTVLRYTGPAAAASRLLDVTAISGVGNQRLSNLRIRGIGLDCNTGLIGYGLSVHSIRDSEIEALVLNAATRGCDMGVVAALAEDKNVQRCKFRLSLRQSEVAAPCLYMDGDAVSNVSMNELWIDAVHKDQPAIIEANADNNIYRYCRIFKVVGGAATECISLFGGISAAQRSRGELFDYLTATLPLHAYGTDHYANASTGHYAALDTENGTPDPIVDIGATVHFEKNSTETEEQPWLSYVPTLASGSGAITTPGALTGSYRKIGKRVEFKVQIPIITNGSAATSLNIGLPVAAAGTVGNIVVGRETALTGKALTGFITTGGLVVSCVFYDGTYPGADGRSFNVAGFYEAA